MELFWIRQLTDTVRKGKKWKLEDHIMEMMKDVVQLLDPKEHFLILNTYSLGFSSVIVENLIRTAFPKVGKSGNPESSICKLQQDLNYH